MSENEIPTEHLVLYEVPLNLRRTETKAIQINTLLLLGISWSRGYRSASHDTYRRRANKLWRKNHPLLSKIYVPMKFWVSDFEWDYWYSPKVELSYGETKTIIRMSSNDAAKAICNDLKAKFYNEKTIR
jgi:hypothetical protein